MDKHIKRLIEMSNYNPKKGKLLTESINEQPIGSPAPTPAPAAVGQPPEQNQAQNDAAFEKEVDLAFAEIVKSLPTLIKQVATTQGDHDGQLEPSQQQVTEALGAIAAGTTMALPAIGNLVGKGISFLGQKTDNQTIQAMGEKVSHVAEHLHHKYLSVLQGILSPYTGSLPPQMRDSINNTIFYAIVAALGAAGAVGASHAAHGGQLGLASVEGGLTSVKATELVNAAKSIIPKILAQVVA
jgi:hypothetical protein